MGRAPIRLALLNDHALVVAGLRAMLEPYADRVLVVDVSVDAPLDAVVDIALYDTFGTAVTEEHWSRFVGRGWAPRYVVLYSWMKGPGPGPDSPVGTPPALEVSKQLDGESLVEALEQICDTGSHDALGADLDEDPDQDADPGSEPGTARTWPGKSEGLTERESEIVFLIVEGLSNHEIADRLFIGINTVKTYIRSAYRRMGVGSRSTAVLWGIDHGFRRHRPSY